MNRLFAGLHPLSQRLQALLLFFELYVQVVLAALVHLKGRVQFALALAQGLAFFAQARALLVVLLGPGQASLELAFFQQFFVAPSGFLQLAFQQHGRLGAQVFIVLLGFFEVAGGCWS